MSKYIIKNCPAYQTFYSDTTDGSSSTLCTKGFTKLYCQDCTDCVMKRIIELCREENAEGENLASIMRLSDKHTKEFLSRFASNKILELLDIQEVE